MIKIRSVRNIIFNSLEYTTSDLYILNINKNISNKISFRRDIFIIEILRTNIYIIIDIIESKKNILIV